MAYIVPLFKLNSTVNGRGAGIQGCCPWLWSLVVLNDEIAVLVNITYSFIVG